MEKCINVKRKSVEIHYGFFGNINYNVHYPTLVNAFELRDLLPFVNRGETEINGRNNYGIVSGLFKGCMLDGNAWDNDYRFFIDVRILPYSADIDVCFRIVENAA